MKGLERKQQNQECDNNFLLCVMKFLLQSCSIQSFWMLVFAFLYADLHLCSYISLVVVIESSLSFGVELFLSHCEASIYNSVE